MYAHMIARCRADEGEVAMMMEGDCESSEEGGADVRIRSETIA